MRIAIAGGTGTLGRRVAEELRLRGHEVRVLSRGSAEYRVDLTTGEGLGAALEGCHVVIDVTNNSSPKAAQTLVGGSRRLLEAGQAAGVRHHVGMSIVGCEKVPMGYFRVKAEQERVVEHGPVPWSLVRATQFHEYVATMLDAGARWRILPVPRAALQTIASAEVALVVADVAEGVPLRGHVDVAGPEVNDARQLARTWRSVIRQRALLLPLPLPGKLGAGAARRSADHRAARCPRDHAVREVAGRRAAVSRVSSTYAATPNHGSL